MHKIIFCHILVFLSLFLILIYNFCIVERSFIYYDWNLLNSNVFNLFPNSICTHHELISLSCILSAQNKNMGEQHRYISPNVHLSSAYISCTTACLFLMNMHRWIEIDLWTYDLLISYLFRSISYSNDISKRLVWWVITLRVSIYIHFNQLNADLS